MCIMENILIACSIAILASLPTGHTVPLPSHSQYFMLIFKTNLYDDVLLYVCIQDGGYAGPSAAADTESNEL